MISSQYRPPIAGDVLQVELHQPLSIRASIMKRFVQTGPLAPKVPAAGQFGEGLNRGHGDDGVAKFEESISGVA